MRIIVAAALALSLGSCAQLQTILQTATTIQASASAPVTQQTLYEVENATAVVFAALNAYKRSCVQKLVPATCRNVIKNLQVYTRNLPPLLKDLRVFVRNNDQVDAATTYNNLVRLIGDVKTLAYSNNVPMGS